MFRTECVLQHLRLQTAERDYPVVMSVFNSPGRMEDNLDWLHPGEFEYLHTLNFPRRRHSYLAGRYVAKHAVAGFIDAYVPFHEIEISHGLLGQPVVTAAGRPNIQVSISHCDDAASALAFPESVPLGIDVELICTSRLDVLYNQLTDRERDVWNRLPFAPEASLTMLWSGKEALSKVLRTGLTMPQHYYETIELEVNSSGFYGRYANFPQHRFLAYATESHSYAITYPYHTIITDIDGQPLESNFHRYLKTGDSNG